MTGLQTAVTGRHQRGLRSSPRRARGSSPCRATFVLPAEYSAPNGQPQRMGDDVLPYLATDVTYLRGLVDTAWSH